jgi:putative acetyltransferase
MITEVEIRETAASDLALLERLYRHSFPDEDLISLVGDLITLDANVLSLAADAKGAMIGHIAFTRGTVGAGGPRVALLAPLAVASDLQRKGVGRALVAAGFERLAKASIAHVYVLGDPGYYARLGFKREDCVRPPYQLPDEWTGAWQSIRLSDAAVAPAGALDLPAVWLKPQLWLP